MFDCLKDADITKFMMIDSESITIEACADFIADSFNNNNCHFAIVDNDDSWNGTISLKNIDYESKQAEYAIITPSYVHGKGFSYAATIEILEYAFYTLGLNRVYLNVVKDNIRANAFYKKVGFVFEGCFRQGILIKGQMHDLNWYSFLKDDFKRPQ